MTWLAWDGAPVLSDGNVWTPLKALRRITDHLLDHLAEIEATLTGQPTLPRLARTHGHAGERLGSLHRERPQRGQQPSASLRGAVPRPAGGLSAAELDQPRPAAWTVRQIAHHVAGVTFYARQVGDLTVWKPDLGRGPARPARATSCCYLSGPVTGP